MSKKAGYIISVVFTTIMVLHIVGAAVAGLLVITALATLIRRKSGDYQKLSRFLTHSFLAQVLSGSLLTLLAVEDGAALKFCVRIALYISVIGVSQVALWTGMKQQRSTFPRMLLVREGVVSLGVIILTLGVIA